MIKKLLVISIILFILYVVFIFSEQDDNSGRIDYKSAVMLEIPPGYYEISTLTDIKINNREIARIFLDAVGKTSNQKQFAIKITKGQQALLFLLHLPDNTLQKREIHSSGTIVEETWRGSILNRLSYAAQNNSFVPPDMAESERKNLYH